MTEPINGKIHVVTMGCSKNLVDSEALLGQLKMNAADLTADVDDADVSSTTGLVCLLTRLVVSQLRSYVLTAVMSGLDDTSVRSGSSERCSVV